MMLVRAEEKKHRDEKEGVSPENPLNDIPFFSADRRAHRRSVIAALRGGHVGG